MPFKYTLPPVNLTAFLQKSDAPDAPMRRTSYCWDVQTMKKWALAAREAYGIETSLLGLIVGAHFKSLRTWGVINHAFKQDLIGTTLGLPWHAAANCGV